MGSDCKTYSLETNVLLTCKNCRDTFQSIFRNLGVPFNNFDSENCCIHLSSAIEESKVHLIRTSLPEGTVLELKSRDVEKPTRPSRSVIEVRRPPPATPRSHTRSTPAERPPEMKRPVILPTAMCRNETEITYADADGYKQRLAVPAFRETEVAAAAAATAAATAAQQLSWPPGCAGNYSLPGVWEMMMNDDNPSACSIM